MVPNRTKHHTLMAKKRGFVEKRLLTLAFLKAKVDFGNLMQSNVINLHEIDTQKWNTRLTSYRKFYKKIFCPSKYSNFSHPEWKK